MPELQPPFFIDRPIGRDGRWIEPHSLRVQVVYANDLLVELRLKLAPGLGLAQFVEDVGQAIVTEIEGAHSGVQASRIDILALLDPSST